MPVIQKVGKAFLVFFGLILALIVIFGTFIVVNPGERGVVLTWGAITGQPLNEGLHFAVPFAQSVVKVQVSTQKLEVASSEAYSKDLQVVDIHSVLNWNVDPVAVNDVYREMQGGAEQLESKIVGPSLEVSIKQIVAKYTAEELLVFRQKVQDEIFMAVKEIVAANHAVVTHYALVDEAFSPAFEAAIERKQVAQQDALTAQNKLEQVKFEADQRVAQAEAEAQAIKIQAEAITQQGGSNYVQLKAVEKWNGILPTYMMADAPMPFLNIAR